MAAKVSQYKNLLILSNNKLFVKITENHCVTFFFTDSSISLNDPFLSHLHLEAARARPHRDLVHLPLTSAPGTGPALTATVAAVAPLALPILPSFTLTTATAAAAVVAARVVLLAPEAGAEAAPELVHPAGPLLEVLQVGGEREKVG